MFKPALASMIVCTMKHLRVSLFAIALLLSACASAPHQPASSGLDVALEPLPGWARDSLYYGTWLDIDQVIAREKTSRLDAVEVQNRMRDRVVADSKIDLKQAYMESLAEVRAGKRESGFKPVTFAKAGEFVVVLDMDETLFQQWHASAQQGFCDLTGVLSDNGGPGKLSTGCIKFTPGVEKFILALKKNPLCKAVVVFSAKEDTPALDIISKWKFSDGSPALSHLDGVFTRNHLVVGKKVTIPSKDLRLFDPELKHVVLIDDNPARIFQPHQLLAFPKFDADQYLKSTKEKGSVVRRHYEAALATALAQIEETARAAEKLKIPFSQSLLPYSYAGTRVLANLERATGSHARALEATRLHPELQEAAFVPVVAK